MPDVCTWTQDDDSHLWMTACQGDFSLEEGTPSENQMRFCCYCGKPLEEHPYEDELDDEEARDGTT